MSSEPVNHDRSDATPNPKVTNLLGRVVSGDGMATDELIPLLYEELHRIAGRLLAHQHPSHTLQATALVNEAYLRLVGGDRSYEDRLHFFRVAARVMRQVLVHHARDKGRLKRGGGRERISLGDVGSTDGLGELETLALDDALRKLSAQDEELARLVELRFFAGMTIAETAEVLKLSTPTIERRWRVARAFLHVAMGDEPEPS